MPQESKTTALQPRPERTDLRAGNPGPQAAPAIVGEVPLRGLNQHTRAKMDKFQTGTKRRNPR